jgi:hypothetical protein
MAFKKFLVQQRVTLNGAVQSSGFVVTMDEADISSFLSNLEGEYTVMEENTTLSGGTDTNVTAVNRVKKISMYGQTSTGASLYSSIRPYRGAILVKNTISSDDIRSSLSAVKPFELSLTDKPTYIGINDGEKVLTSTT